MDINIRNSCQCICGKIKFCDLFPLKHGNQRGEAWTRWLRWLFYGCLVTTSNVLKFICEIEDIFLQKLSIF